MDSKKLFELSQGMTYYKEHFQDQLVIFYDEEIQEIFDLSDPKEAVKAEIYRASVIKEGYEVIKIDAEGHYILPGFMDVHIHGYKGADVMDARVKSLQVMKKELPENGVTSFLATTMTMGKKTIMDALNVLETVMADQEHKPLMGAQIIGVHLEGPFINKSFKGAQAESYIMPVDYEIIDRYRDIIKVVTIAPEIEGGLKTIIDYKDTIRFSVGHSGANYDEGMAAFECGAQATTHLFNAMTGLHHREPGLVGAALNSDCYSELIADHHHVHKDLYRLLVKVKGLDKILLITDCMQAGGLCEGDYMLGDQNVTISEGQCRLPSGTLAGSVLKLNEGFKNFVLASKESMEKIVPLLTINPAKYLGIEDQFGSLVQGKRADIVIMKDTYEIVKTIVKGKIVYES